MRVTKRQCEDVLTTALEGGYAEEFRVHQHERNPEDARIIWAIATSDGYEGEETEVLEEHRHGDTVYGVRFDAALVRKGLERLDAWVREDEDRQETYLGQQWQEGREDGWEYLDAIGADAVLQFAAFGEVVYG